MKTIIDAVKYYGGHNFVVGKHETHHTHIANSSISNNIYSAYIYDIHKDNVICSIKEFNNAINDMQYNFGKVTHGDFYDYINADKEILQPVKTDLIYTQEMCDSGEPPSVGMEFMTSIGLYKSVYIGFHCGDYIIVGQGVDDISTFEIEQCLPIAPTVKLIDGKAYQFGYQGITRCGFYNVTSNSFYLDKKGYRRICEFKSLSGCTNIQLLTVGDK